MKVLIPSIARFGRLAYPGRREVTNYERLGRRNHGCPTAVCRSGRSDWGGEQTCGPEHQEMTAASTYRPCESRCTGIAERRPGPNGGKADVVGEETGRGTSRAAGVGVQARREGCAEITSGRSEGPAGGGPTCQDSLREPKAQRGRGPRTGTSGRSSKDEKVRLL